MQNKYTIAMQAFQVRIVSFNAIAILKAISIDFIMLMPVFSGIKLLI